MKILLVCGSIAEKSHTNAMLRHIESLLQNKKIETSFWDLKERPLPFALPQYHHDPMSHPEESVRAFATEVEAADVIILGTPLYHGSYSGVLKNALDNLKMDVFRDKWVGLVGNQGSPRADMVAFSHLRWVVNTVYGYCLQTQVKSCKADYLENETGYVLTEEVVLQRCQRLVEEILKFQND